MMPGALTKKTGRCSQPSPPKTISEEKKFRKFQKLFPIPKMSRKEENKSPIKFGSDDPDSPDQDLNR